MALCYSATRNKPSKRSIKQIKLGTKHKNFDRNSWFHGRLNSKHWSLSGWRDKVLLAETNGHNLASSDQNRRLSTVIPRHISLSRYTKPWRRWEKYENSCARFGGSGSIICSYFYSTRRNGDIRPVPHLAFFPLLFLLFSQILTAFNTVRFCSIKLTVLILYFTHLFLVAMSDSISKSMV